jgi:hypothetical protein
MIIEEYDPKTMMRPDSSVLIFGGRGSGKTTMVKYLLSCMSDRFEQAYAFAPSREYDGIMPHGVLDKFDGQALAKICCAHKAPELHRTAIVFDGTLSKKHFRNPAVRDAMVSGRHDGLFLLNAAASIYEGPPKDLRTQVDVVIAFKETQETARRYLRAHAMTCFETDEELSEAYEELREHEALVFDKAAHAAGRPYLFSCLVPHDLLPFTESVCDDSVPNSLTRLTVSELIDEIIDETVSLRQSEQAHLILPRDSEVMEALDNLVATAVRLRSHHTIDALLAATTQRTAPPPTPTPTWGAKRLLATAATILPVCLLAVYAWRK